MFECLLQVPDMSLQDYVAVKEKYARYLPHSAGRFAAKRFRKAQVGTAGSRVGYHRSVIIRVVQIGILSLKSNQIIMKFKFFKSNQIKF